MRRVPLGDVVAAVALTAFLVLISGLDRSTQLASRPMNGLGIALLVVSGMSLAVRRVLPRTVFVVSVAAAAGYIGLRFPSWPVYIGAVTALVLVVFATDRRQWLPLAVAGGVAVALATGPREAWAPARVFTVALAWAVVAFIAGRVSTSRRRLVEAHANRRVAEERLRIARELHDVLSHSLAAVSLQAGVGLHLLERQPERVREALEAIRHISTDALAQARAALSAVRDPDGVPGLADLDALAAGFRRSGLRIDLAVTLDGTRVPEPIGAAAYRIVQEALTNVARHAGVGVQAFATITSPDGWLDIEVRDDGPGLAGLAAPHGHGLRGMAERAVELGGTLAAGPEPGRGFVVRARLPLPSVS
jgi:signal transduction histidine kinase